MWGLRQAHVVPWLLMSAAFFGGKSCRVCHNSHTFHSWEYAWCMVVCCVCLILDTCQIHVEFCRGGEGCCTAVSAVAADVGTDWYLVAIKWHILCLSLCAIKNRLHAPANNHAAQPQGLSCEMHCMACEACVTTTSNTCTQGYKPRARARATQVQTVNS